MKKPKATPPPLTKEQWDLVLRYRDTVVGRALWQMRTMWMGQSILSRDEAESEALWGLVTAASRWGDYCKEHGLEMDEDYFATYALRRAKGAIVDRSRLEDHLSRKDRKIVKEGGVVIHHAPVSIEAEQEWGSFDVHSAEPHAASSIFVQDSLQLMVETIRGLPQIQQVVLAMVYYEGKLIQEIAEETGHAESRLSREHTEAVLEVFNTMRSFLADQEN